jgi:outer membrane protein OmpA-like peptidoglycan-associated protein
MIVDDSKLRMDLNGKIAGDKTTNAIENLKLYLLNKDKNIIDSTLSGKDGEFKFKYIPYSDQFYFKIKDTSVINSYKSIIIYDKNGSIVKYVTVKNKELFEYKLLQNDLNMLQEIYLHDPWMNLSYQVSKNNPKAPITIMENIYFESGKADILQASKQTLDKIVFTLKNNPTIKIEIGAHTDSKGSDELNLKLSEKRAQSALNYFVSKGIDRLRITAMGYGEKKLLNKCINGTACSEEEHSKNRRLEFKVIIQ